MQCRRELMVSGIPASIRNTKDLREIAINIGSLYNVPVRTEDVFQCIRLKKENQVIIKFANVFVKEDIMSTYLRHKDLKLSQILDTDVESRVYLNHSYPPLIQRNLLYCRRLKKLDVIEGFMVNFANGHTTVTNKDKSTKICLDHKELSSIYPLRNGSHASST